MEREAGLTTVYDFRAEALDGKEISLGDYAGQVLLVVNTASECGFTPQYEGLEQLWRTYRERGFSVLGFPCNQFGAQEPGSSSEIGAFCSRNYGVTFPMFAKVEVNGAGAHPLYKYLTDERHGLFGTRSIKWNFTKFLIDREGRPIARYGSRTKPAALGDAIEKLL